MTRYHRNLHEYLDTLERHGKLVRVTKPVNKDTELHPLVRLQFRGLPEDQRKAFLFENVVDSRGKRYDIPVAVACIAANREVYALGLTCRPDQIRERWARAYAHPIPPVVVERGPVQEFVLEGRALEEAGGLDRLPMTISTPGFDNAPYTTASHWVSKEPETDVYNLGNYRGQLKAPLRLGCMTATPFQGLRRHWLRYRELGIPRMPAAAVIGAPPAVSYASVVRIPEHLTEYEVAGGLAGEPVELVRCRTVDLLVPAEAEIVIEGFIPTDALELEGPFGEFPGYMAARGYAYFLEVTCITHRREPIYEDILSQFPPSESSKMRQIARENLIRRRIEQDLGYAGRVRGVAFPEAAGSWGVCVVSFKKETPDEPQRILEVLHREGIGKLAIVVDDDIDPYNLDAVLWALAWRMQPHRDVQVLRGAKLGLDPSVAPPDAARDTLALEQMDGSILLMDATRKWSYPPLSLPRREFMEHAVELWKALGLPELALKEPWFGYPLGYWTEEEEEEARLAVQGRYYETGRKFEQQNRQSV